jgi:hypothetical protein
MDMPLLTVTLSRSRRLAGGLAVAHGLAAACAVACVPGWGWSGAALAAIAASLVRALGRDAWLTAPAAVAAVSLRDDGGCDLRLRDGSILPGTVAGASFVSVGLVALVVRLDRGGVRAVAILADSAPADDLRRLRAWLRLRPAPPPSARA